MRFEVLGRVRAFDDGVPDHDEQEIGLGGPKQQLVLALLLAQPNSTVPADVLVEQIWGDSQPSTARHTMQGYISELRKLLGPVVERSGAGYVVRVDRTSLDSLNFEALVSDGQSLAATDPQLASDRLAEALTLWRADPFLGLDDHGSLTSEIGRLIELRLVALESRISVDLELARHGELVGELETLTNDYPFREEFRAQHMIALYRSGRQAEALRAYQRTRVALADELGIEASPKLRRLEEQILVQDPALDLAVEDGPGIDPLGPIHNPYKGLRAFSETDADDFFGRTRLISQLEAALVVGKAPLVTVAGPSGSGKSSVVHAGLLPVLRGSGGVLVASMLPGTDPYVELEAALLRSVDGSPATLLGQLTDGDTGLLRTVLRLLPTDGDRLVLVIDQFEELFTLVEDSLRADFLAALVAAASDPRGRVQILFTLRADFYDRPLMHPEFGQLMTGNVINVTPLAPDELEVAALGPAQRMGVDFEAGLLAEVLADVAGQPNALPLFQYALTELFDRREDSTLTLAAYREIGGLQKAVATRAEETYGRLGADQQEAALQLFLRLVTVGDHSETRRRVSAAELISLDIDPVAMQGAVEAFGSHRLLTLDRDPFSGAPTVEVAHEALLTEWVRLRGWIVDNREYLMRLAALDSAVDEWLTADRDPDFLLTGGRLDQYERWWADTPTRLTATEREFLDQAVAQRTTADAAEASRIAGEDRLRRRARRTTVAFAGLALVVAVAAVAIVVALNSDGSQPTVAVFGVADADDDQVGELFAQGISRIEQDLGVSPDMIDPLLPAEETLGDLSADLVILEGAMSQRVLWPEVAAVLDSQTHYVVEDLPPEDAPEGMTNVIWGHEEGGFLAGVAAAATTETGTVGYVGAAPIFQGFRAGFEAGVHWVDEEVEVLAVNLVDFGTENPWGDQELGKELATGLYEAGADVVFHAAGPTGFGVFEAAEELSEDGEHLWAIGVDTDQWETAGPGQRPHILTSVIKRVDEGVYTIVSDFVDGTLEPGTQRFDVANGFFGLSQSGDHLTAQALSLVEEAERLVVSGEMEVPARATGPLIGPPADIEVTVVFDGEVCDVRAPASLTRDAAFGFELINESEAAATIVLADFSGSSFAMTSASALPGATAGHSAVAMGEELAVFCVIGPAMGQDQPSIPAEPIPVR